MVLAFIPNGPLDGLGGIVRPSSGMDGVNAKTKLFTPHFFSAFLCFGCIILYLYTEIEKKKALKKRAEAKSLVLVFISSVPLDGLRDVGTGGMVGGVTPPQ